MSGMSNMEQMVDNVATFEREDPRNEEECVLLMELDIPVPDLMRELTRIQAEMPSWKEIGRQREEAAKGAGYEYGSDYF